MRRRGHGWCGAAVVVGLALAFLPASAAAAGNDPVTQVVGQVHDQVQGLTGQPAPALPRLPSSAGGSSPSKPAPSKPAPAAAPSGPAAGRIAPPRAYTGSSPRASSSGTRATGRAENASPSARIASNGSARASAGKPDPTDAAPHAAASPASKAVNVSGHQDGSLPFTGWEPLPVALLGLLSIGLGSALLRVVRKRGSGAEPLT
jgi:hypothetical protein